MKKWCFSFLVLANAVLAAYQFAYKPKTEVVNHPVFTENNIVLLSEAIEAGAATKKSVERIAETGGQKKEKQYLCTQIGPFKANESAEQVVQRLTSSGIRTNLRKIDIPVAPDFWVYIPPLPSRQAAVRKLRELQASKVDSFIISEGELANGISLGLFTQKELAEQLMERRRDKGYDAHLKELPRVRGEYWIEVSHLDQDLLSNQLWRSIKERYGFIEKQNNLCDTDVATGQ